MWHKWSNHLLPGEVFSCDECGKIFSSRSSQNRHIRDQHMHQHQNVICPICEKVFRNKNSLSNHVALYHKQRNWKIPLVIVSFAKKIVKIKGESSIADHLCCYECDKTFKAVSSYRRHIRDYHGDANTQVVFRFDLKAFTMILDLRVLELKNMTNW